jgi:hypothetical protein
LPTSQGSHALTWLNDRPKVDGSNYDVFDAGIFDLKNNQSASRSGSAPAPASRAVSNSGFNENVDMARGYVEDNYYLPTRTPSRPVQETNYVSTHNQSLALENNTYLSTRAQTLVEENNSLSSRSQIASQTFMGDVPTILAKSSLQQYKHSAEQMKTLITDEHPKPIEYSTPPITPSMHTRLEQSKLGGSTAIEPLGIKNHFLAPVVATQSLRVNPSGRKSLLGLPTDFKKRTKTFSNFNDVSLKQFKSQSEEQVLSGLNSCFWNQQFVEVFFPIYFFNLYSRFL